jgi:uncharacterized protein YggE
LVKRTILCVLLVMSSWAFAQGPARPVPNTVTVGADGEFESAPDTAVLTFNLSAQEPTSQAAFQHASRAAEQMRQALRSAGIDPKTAEISSYSLEPLIDYRNPKQRVIGYRAGTTVTLKMKDFSKVGPVTEALSPIQETSGESVSYTLENMDEAKKQAVAKAYQRARAYAESLAKAAGREIGTLSSATVDIQEPGIRPLMMSARASVAGSINGNLAPTEGFQEQKIRITAHVNAEFAMQ